jgi:PAS domain S-box-containing protein
LTRKVSTPMHPNPPPEGLLARLLDSLADIFTVVLDQEQRIIYANAAFLEHFGMGWEKVSGQLCFELVSPFSWAESKEGGARPLTVDPLYPSCTLLSRETGGENFIYEATFYPLLDGAQGHRTIGILRDVTDKFLLESQVRRLYELERNLVQASIDGIIANDLSGNILIFNEGAANILGYEPEEVIGKIKVDQLYPSGLAREVKRLIYKPAYGGEGILENYETVVRHRNGRQVPIWLSARLLTEEGREIGIVGYFRDLRERKRMEAELLRHERLATLGQMVVHISHEIKNPLLLIGGFARQLERLSEWPPEVRRKLHLIHEEVQRLERFLDDLATFTRSSSPQQISGDLVAVIQEVAELMEDGFSEKGVSFRLQAQPSIPLLRFDPGQIRQVLINIFKNALEAMPQGGLLTVRVESKQDYLWLTVKDTGQGILPEHLPALFTPFFSTKEKGTGLGLTISRGLIEQHRGEIRIESEVDRGTTCIIRLPLSSA